MKRNLTAVIAVILALVMAFADPVRVLAEDPQIYISDLKVGMGKKAADAENALKGYTIITGADGKYVDFNDNAGGGWASKGEKVVYIGYRTTGSKDEAITDIALMNMKGGYKTEDYDALMEDYINIQIIPFVESFISAIREYRENLNSPYPANRERAERIREALNKLTDDDCGGAGLGDLLLNETKYEMGDTAYDKLSDAEKKKHADIVTIIAQANGVATLSLENLLVRASDTAETSWLDRAAVLTYDDLLEETGLSLSKAKQAVAKLYDDAAMHILDMWDAFKEQLDKYDENVVKLEELQNEDLSQWSQIVENFEFSETMDEKKIEEYGEALARIKNHAEELSNVFADVMCKELLENIETEDGTLLDLFTLSSEEIEEDVTVLYPVAAALSEGQRAGLEFLTLEDLVMIGATNEDGYDDADYEEKEPVSIYDNVDRGIYEKGGVGLTSDTLRSRAAEELALEKNNGYLSPLTYAMMGISAAGFVAFGTALTMMIKTNHAVKAITAKIATLEGDLLRAQTCFQVAQLNTENFLNMGMMQQAENFAIQMKDAGEMAMKAEGQIAANTKYLSRLKGKSATCGKLSAGIGVAVIILVGVTTYLSYRDMVNHYKVEFTPIPRFMVDEKDITAFNNKGEKIVIKNQEAYYKAATCNRSSGDEFYNVLGDIADLNGDVGKQWLAMYYSKNETEQPILADSLKVVTGNSQLPANYSTGIHMFGTGAAENINNSLYVWNSDARSVYVYFMHRDTGSNLSGSGFSSGSLAIAGGAGLGLGALVSGLLVNVANKNKKNKETESEEE